MLFEIDHLTRYDYSVPVQLGEHLLRFEPLQRDGQWPVCCQLQIDPTPVAKTRFVDSWGNTTYALGFDGETEHLAIGAHIEVETSVPATQASPADFLLPDGALQPHAVPAGYSEPVDDPVVIAAFVAPLLTAANGSGLTFLHALNRSVHGLYHQGVRLDGPPMAPAETLATGAGVCRDLTVLFIAACRQTGLAARFVSGYQQGDGTRQLRYLHAWPEVYVPGSGWLGFDPTHAAPVGADHVAIAAAPAAAAVTPVEGGYRFRGAALNSTLETEIRISTR